LDVQGFEVHNNIVFQDNQSDILLEKNGIDSSGCHARHINIRYFFILDCIVNGELRFKYCPTGDMVGDVFTNPLLGSPFHKLQTIILNSPDESN
jgi:hypothetical protein